MDKNQIKKLQESFSRDELEEMIKPDIKLSASERLHQSIRNKKLKRSGLHYLKNNMKEQMALTKLQNDMNKKNNKSNMEKLLETVKNSKLNKMHSSGLEVSTEEYSRCLSVLNGYLYEHSSVCSIDQIPEFDKIGNDNIRNIVHKIAYYDKYASDEDEEIEL